MTCMIVLGSVGNSKLGNASKSHCIFFLAAKEFSPDLTIISAGFDAARGDPLGGCDVRMSSFV